MTKILEQDYQYLPVLQQHFKVDNKIVSSAFV